MNPEYPEEYATDEKSLPWQLRGRIDDNERRGYDRPLSGILNSW